jgi:exopolysaccharide production protein ExoZ
LVFGAMTSARRPDRLILVQALRAAAALLVVVHHVQNDAAILAARSGAAFAPSTILPWQAGVDVFFVISGFIIVHAARPLFGRAGAPRRFLAHRIARVAPLYWLVTTLYLGVALVVPGVLEAGARGGGPTLGGAVASYLFWPWARPDGAVMPLYSLGWTLNYEALFYGLFAPCLLLPRRAAAAAVLAMLLALALIGARVALPLPFAFWANPIVLEFAFGVVVGLARAEGLRLPAPGCAALAAAGLGLLALAGDDGPRALAWGGPAALLVAAAALGRDAGRTEGPWVRVAVAVGDASYALYLVHPFVSRALRELAWRSGLDAGPLPFILAAVAASVAASLLIHRWIERPLVRRTRALLEPAGEGLRAADARP